MPTKVNIILMMNQLQQNSQKDFYKLALTQCDIPVLDRILDPRWNPIYAYEPDTPY